MRGLPAGVYIPGYSSLHRLDARAKIVSLLLLITAMAVTSTLYGYLVILGVVAGIFRLSGLPYRAVLAPVGRLWPFFLLIFLMNTLFYDTAQTLWSWGVLSLSEEGMRQGARVGLNVFFLMILGQVLTGTTAPLDMTAGLSRLLSPLRLLRVPVEDVAMIIGAAVQFVPVLLEETEQIKKAQTARGARFESKRLTERLRSVLPLAAPIFLSAFRRADELALAMEARGYRNAKQRTKKEKMPLGRRDVAALVGSGLVCLAQICLMS